MKYKVRSASYTLHQNEVQMFKACFSHLGYADLWGSGETAMELEHKKSKENQETSSWVAYLMLFVSLSYLGSSLVFV